MIGKKYYKKIKEMKVYSRSQAMEAHITKDLIDHSCLVELEGAPPILYIEDQHPALEQLPLLINKVTFNASNRAANKGQKSILFGAVNGKINKLGFCTQGALYSNNPELDYILCNDFAIAFDNILRDKLPQRHKVGKVLIDKQNLHSQYRFCKTNYTSGIINVDSAFNYHVDDFNLDNTYSSMVVFKRDMIGGHLIFPEYGIGFKLNNQSLIHFCGKKLLHGVSPIEKLDEGGYRISVVYYASKDLNHCLPYEQELNKAKSKLYVR
ncbi:hypothetical protein [Pedobacter nanyangensis]|uniref:hypothetical protein n=1 Tax=Pedobacter nanyangensis TaxID=1562389 RepID=UPI000DE4014F|nr:hypothetical protein [Pedobacter nanyangensis]